jgi:adenylate cyclase class 2
MIEVEIKAALKEKEELTAKMLELGFVKGDLLKETDVYFDSPHHKMKENDTALRIRSCENLTQGTKVCYMTYKGPKMDKISISRKEVGMEIESVETGTEIFTSLGFFTVPAVIKHRQWLHLDNVTACLDSVEDLGDFLELEMVIADASEKEAALNDLIALLEKLGYGREDLLQTSYLSMLQKKRFGDNA